MRPRRAFVVLGLLAACGSPDGAAPGVVTDDGGVPDASGPVADGGVASDADTELKAVPGLSRYAIVGEEIVLDGTASTGATRYQWNLGDGRTQAEAIARVTYPKPGRYTAVLTVSDDAGRSRSAGITLSVTHPVTFTRSESSTVLALPDVGRVAVVSTDSNEVVLVSDRKNGLAVVQRWSVPGTPRTIVRFGEWLAVPCENADTVELLPVSGTASARKKIDLPYGARPYGAAVVGSDLFVSLAGKEQLARIRIVAGAPTIVGTIDGVIDARAVAALPGGRLGVTRWRSADTGGRVFVVDGLSGTPTVTSVGLAFDPQLASDTEIGGVPSYLNGLAVAPTGKEMAIPSLQANIADGVFKNGRALTFETTVRAIASFVDLVTGTEQVERRKQFDNRGLAGAATYTSHGDYLYVAMPGNRTIERLDVLTEVLSGSVQDVGFAPDGVALSSDDGTLYVNAALSRELVVYDTSAFSTPAPPLARIALVTAEPLDAKVLTGKRLFNDSFDPRLSKDGYMACAHCHLEGDSDRRVWDFTDRGEGLRNTTSLLGRAGTGDGPIHWSANFDEVQDFEHDIRDAFQGKGLMSNGDFHTGTRDQKLGDPKAGVSADLDALAAYVTSLASVPRSPKRPAEGQLDAAATRGATVFANAGCPTCHSGARFTDSGWISPGVPRLHDVGTITAGSGKRLGGALPGIDTPTLRGVWATPPYLHDGSAPTLRDVVTTKNPANAHGSTTSLTPAQIDDLVAYLSSL